MIKDEGCERKISYAKGEYWGEASIHLQRIATIRANMKSGGTEGGGGACGFLLVVERNSIFK